MTSDGPSPADTPTTDLPTRDDLATQYLDQLPYEPYPVQEEALLAWFSSDQGVMVCAPTGTGKTLIAEAAVFEALHRRETTYYTTPLIALTEQKFQELQASAVRWGFSPEDVGLVTGNRRVNPDARVLVVVAEILLNRLLHREAFDFQDVSSVVMDEFHSFNDRERGIVWELSLGLLPPHVRLLLLSATVGNSVDFLAWLRQSHQRHLELVRSEERKVPLTFEWVPDKLLTEQLESMYSSEDANSRTPALIFCFNREECWQVAEQLKGKRFITDVQQKQLSDRLEEADLSQGAGPKLKRLLLRGIGVHHAGMLPKYRRLVEELYQAKLLSLATCTETLSAGINLPARSVVMPNLMKGPPGKKKIIEASSAHQIFGRAGRPQFDTQGYVFALAHEDDVKILRWKEKYDQIPEDTKDPGLRKAKKTLKKKMPKRRTGEQYWTQAQFEKLRTSPPGNLSSKGTIPWRLLAYYLLASPEVSPLRALIHKRLLDSKHTEQQLRYLDRMLLTLWRAGYVELEPPPPTGDEAEPLSEASEKPATSGLLSGLLSSAEASSHDKDNGSDTEEDGPPRYQPEKAHPRPELDKLIMLRSIHPLYGVFLANHLGIASQEERLQAMESVLEMPGTVARYVRVPPQDQLPPGPLATTRLDEQLLRLGLVTAEQLAPSEEDEDPRDEFGERVWVLTLADKLRIQFEHDFPGVGEVRVVPVWAAGEILEYGGDFNKYITSKGLQKQEGLIFRHLLRLILLVGEFQQLCPPDISDQDWHDDLEDIKQRLTVCCQAVDPTSTEKTLVQAQAVADL